MYESIMYALSNYYLQVHGDMTSALFGIIEYFRTLCHCASMIASTLIAPADIKSLIMHPTFLRP